MSNDTNTTAPARRSVQIEISDGAAHALHVALGRMSPALALELVGFSSPLAALLSEAAAALRAALAAPAANTTAPDTVVVSRKVLQDALDQMQADWIQIDGEWGPCSYDFTEAMDRGECQEAAALRAALAAPAAASGAQRPESFEFAMEFLGDPEAAELRAYIEQLERAAASGAGPTLTDEQIARLMDGAWGIGSRRADAVAGARRVLAAAAQAAPQPQQIREAIAVLKRVLSAEPVIASSIQAAIDGLESVGAAAPADTGAAPSA